MAIGIYMDHHVPSAITVGLRLRGADVITAYEDKGHELPDPELLDRVAELNRVIFTRDDDFLVEAVRRQREGIWFSGVIYAHQLRVSIGDCVENLALIAEVGKPEDLANTILFLPL